MSLPFMTVIKSCQPHQPTSVVLATFALILLTSNCAQSQDLTRSRASNLISQAKEFKEPAAVALKDEYENVSVPAQSDDEDESVAQPRAVEAFLGNHPALAILQHMGLIEITAQVIQKPKTIKAPEFKVERPDGSTARTPLGKDSLAPWKFLIRVNLTEKGKKEAGSDGRTIPLFTKRVIEVTGIIKTQNGGAQAEFTWRAIPTSVGEAFDPTSAAYKSLPPKLQQGLKQPIGLLQRTPLADTSEINTAIRKAIAYFQRYDNGWRLVYIQ
ncbi:MAG TPA: hypothetical protein VF553_22150 [Pyrinomonadaceae bacterium]|jgi:hypothetical protein